MPSNDTMLVGNDWQNGVVCVKIKCWHLHGETEVYHESLGRHCRRPYTRHHFTQLTRYLVMKYCSDIQK
jgi:hypothetical protein